TAAGGFWVVNPESVATAASLEELLTESAAISLGEALLADADYFRWSHFPQAIPGAVLLAAIGCEVRVKEVIRATAGERKAAVELLMERPRDFSVAARSLFSDVMAAANGRSLKQEHPDLEKRLGRVFEIRNGIAHKGAIPSLVVARECVETARDVMVW